MCHSLGGCPFSWRVLYWRFHCIATNNCLNCLQQLDYQEFRIFIVACIEKQVEIEEKRENQMEKYMAGWCGRWFSRWCNIQ